MLHSPRNRPREDVAESSHLGVDPGLASARTDDETCAAGGTDARGRNIGSPRASQERLRIGSRDQHATGRFAEEQRIHAHAIRELDAAADAQRRRPGHAAFGERHGEAAAPDVVRGTLLSNADVLDGKHGLEDLTVEILKQYGITPGPGMRGGPVLR